jgi:hypothetical protein
MGSKQVILIYGGGTLAKIAMMAVVMASSIKENPLFFNQFRLSVFYYLIDVTESKLG